MRRRRQDQLEIPADNVDLTGEVLGRGGFGTVYLADFNGFNAAAKVVSIKPEDVSTHSSSGGGGGGRNLKGDGSWRRDDDRERRGVGDGKSATDQHRDQHQRHTPQNAFTGGVAETRQHRAFLREVETMKRMADPHIVRVYGAVTSLQDRLVLVMELLPGGDLRHRLQRARRPLEERTLRGIVADVCCGMAVLHACTFVHGGLKSANVLFDANGRAKVCVWDAC